MYVYVCVYAYTNVFFPPLSRMTHVIHHPAQLTHSYLLIYLPTYILIQAMELGFVVLAAYCMVNEGLSMGRLLAFKSCLEMFVRGFNTLSGKKQ